uniref:Uncharacterized protein n=1 Tax=Nothobranchius kuhntae TaxID=321403 RepID=A0A1A8K9G3_NOTKU
MDLRLSVEVLAHSLLGCSDVSCHVLAALPVPLGQCDCHPAVSGHFLPHHPAASGDQARTDHSSHDRGRHL